MAFQAASWASTRENVEAVFVDYNDLVAAPERNLEQVRSLIDTDVDPRELASIVDPNLYRNRANK